MKNKRSFNIILVTLFVVGIVLAFGFWYKQTYSMGRAESQQVGDPNLASKVLIATQGSAFKNEVLEGILQQLKTRQVFIKVIDVTDLTEVDPAQWTAIVIVHTWEMGSPPTQVSHFVTTTNSTNLIVLATSGDGAYHIEGVDGITSASKNTEIERCVREIVARIDKQLAEQI